MKVKELISVLVFEILINALLKFFFKVTCAKSCVQITYFFTFTWVGLYQSVYLLTFTFSLAFPHLEGTDSNSVGLSHLGSNYPDARVSS